MPGRSRLRKPIDPEKTQNGKRIRGSGRQRARGGTRDHRRRACGGGRKPKQRARQKPQPGRQVAARRPDTYIWGIYLSLLLISVIELFSASSTEVRASNVYAPLIRHCVFLGGGLLIVAHLPEDTLFRLPQAGVADGHPLARPPAPVIRGGSGNQRRAAGHTDGTITIQPPEIVKLTVVLLLAGVLARNPRFRAGWRERHSHGVGHSDGVQHIRASQRTDQPAHTHRRERMRVK